jgi:hypothetical protein
MSCPSGGRARERISARALPGVRWLRDAVMTISGRSAAGSAEVASLLGLTACKHPVYDMS